MFMLYCRCRSGNLDKDRTAKDNTAPLAQILNKVIKDMAGPKRLTAEEIASAWKYAAGKAAAKHTKPVSIKKGQICINVDRSSWLYELTISKKKILEKLNGKLKKKKIKDIRFRIGEIDSNCSREKAKRKKNKENEDKNSKEKNGKRSTV